VAAGGRRGGGWRGVEGAGNCWWRCQPRCLRYAVVRTSAGVLAFHSLQLGYWFHTHALFLCLILLNLDMMCLGQNGHKWHLGFVCCLWWLCLCIAIQHRDNWSDVHACCIYSIWNIVQWKHNLVDSCMEIIVLVAFRTAISIFRKKRKFIPVSTRVLHTTNSYYSSRLLVFF